MALAEEHEEHPTRIPEWSLGERLAKARRDAELTQEEMAERLGVSASAVAKWETNRGKPRDVIDMTGDWARHTGVSQAWILGLSSPCSYLEVLHGPDGQMELPLVEEPELELVAS